MIFAKIVEACLIMLISSAQAWGDVLRMPRPAKRPSIMQYSLAYSQSTHNHRNPEPVPTNQYTHISLRAKAHL